VERIASTARRHHVDLRFLHLDHRTAGIGERVELLVDCLAERPDALDRVLVVILGTAAASSSGMIVPTPDPSCSFPRPR